MNFHMDTQIETLQGSFSCRKVAPERAVSTLSEDVREGLLDAPRSLPPKLFNAAGFSLKAHYEPSNNYFSLILAQPN